MNKIRRISISRLAALATIIALPVAILSLIFGFLAYKSAWDIAVISGVGEKAIVSLGLNKIRLQPGNPISVLYGARRLSEAETVAIGSLPFTLANEGSKTVDPVIVTFRFPVFLKRKGLEAMAFNTSGSIMTADIRRSFTSDRAFDYSSYELKSLNPGMGIAVNEPFYTKETRLSTDAPITSKDGVHGVVSLSMLYSVNWLVTVSGHDIPTVNYTVSVGCTPAASINELGLFAEKYLIPEKIRDFRKELGFFQYLGGLIFRDEKTRILLVYQETAEHLVENDKMLLAPRTTGEVGQITFSLLAWDHLFE
jgi:hypothetical protein